MLSTENPPDPSCSSNISALKSHERASEKVAFQEAKTVVLEDKPTPNFSIRDYVLASRGKGIEASWPFPQQFLQLCLKHGAKDLLPPFEPPDLVRAQCLRKPAQPERPVAYSEADNIIADDDLYEPRCVGPFNKKPASIRLESHNSPLEELVSNSSDPAIESSPEAGKSTADEGTNLDEPIHPDAKITPTVRNHHPTEQTSDQNVELTCSVAVSRSASETPSELGTTESSQILEKLCKPLEKKCRLKVKLNAISETSQVDNVASNSSTVSDPMATKVCPVCKTFSSTSNTTLNAHMDQCLFMESNTKSVLSEVPKIKVKQRKKRLMVDIYMTAPHCTLEDLDRRNGTNWVAELALLAAPTSGVGNEIKRAKVSTMESIDDGDDSEVYVDSNGMKVRILSKFDDAPLEEGLKLRKHARDMKAGKSILNRKKKNFASKYSKIMKVKAQRKKLRPFKLLKNQLIATPEGDHISTDQQQNEPQPYISHAENQGKSSAPATLRQWVCSIQSDLPKALTDKSSNITLESTSSVNRTILAENSQSDPCNSSAGGSHHNKFSRPSEGLTGSPKMKRVDCLYNDFHPMNDVKRKSLEPLVSNSRWSSKCSNATNGLLKLSKSSVTCQSSKSKSVEIDMNSQHKSDKCSNLAMRPLESCPSFLKEQAIFTSKKNILVKRPYFHLEGRKGEASERPSTSLKFRKHRSILRTGKRGPPYLLPMNAVHGTTKSFGLNVTRKNRTVCTRQSGLLNNLTRSEAKVMNQGSPSQGNIPESEKQESSGTVEEQEDNSSNKLPLRSGSHDTQTEDSDVQLEALDSEAMEEAVGDPITDDFMNSDNLGINFSIRSYSCPCADDVHSISGSEVHVQLLKQRSDEQDIVCDDISCNEIDQQDIQMADEAADRGEHDCCAVQPTDCQAETTSVQDSSGCLTSHGDVELVVPRKSPSITSFIVTADHDKYLFGNSGPSGSPLSTGSTISLPSSEDSKLKDLEAEPSPGAIAVQDKLGLASQTAESIGAAEQRNSTVRNEEVKENLPAKVPDKCLDDQPLCCSCRESISRDSQFLRQNDTFRTAKANQVPNLFIGPRISSSFSAYQNWIVANSRLESSDQSFSINNSLDSTAKYPTCIDLGSPSPSPQSQNQSTSSPMLRLMGKNLMVVNNEQLVQPQTTTLDYTPNVNSGSHGFASTNNLLKQESSSHHYHQLLGGFPAISQALSTGDHQMLQHLPITAMGGFARPPFHFGWTTKPDQQTQQKKPYKRPNSSRDPYMMDGVIVIDDSCPEHENEFRGCLASPASSLLLTTSGPSPLPQRSLSCFPSESQTRNISVGPGALLPNFHPMVDASFVNHRINSEGQGPPLPSPPIFQSPRSGQMGTSMYYSPIL